MEEPIAKRTRRRLREIEERENQRSWADLDRDALIIIYHKLGIKHLILSGAPLCCSSWYKASKEPSLWREINLNGFSSSRIKNQVQSRKLIEFVVDRSSGSLTSIDFPPMADEDDLLYISERCPGLNHFSLRSRSKQMDEEKIFLAISKLSQLESMTIDGDIHWDEILIILKPALSFLYPNRVCKLIPRVEELYRAEILNFFTHTWRSIYQIREFKRSICELEGSIRELSGSINPHQERSIRELEGSVRELKGSINLRHDGLIPELKGSIHALMNLSARFVKSIYEKHELKRKLCELEASSNSHQERAQKNIRR